MNFIKKITTKRKLNKIKKQIFFSKCEQLTLELKSSKIILKGNMSNEDELIVKNNNKEIELIEQNVNLLTSQEKQLESFLR